MHSASGVLFMPDYVGVFWRPSGRLFFFPSVYLNRLQRVRLDAGLPLNR
jgi:hypothetical protein